MAGPVGTPRAPARPASAFRPVRVHLPPAGKRGGAFPLFQPVKLARRVASLICFCATARHGVATAGVCDHLLLAAAL